MAGHVELYEALKPHVGEEAAAMIADALPAGRDLATRADLYEVEARISHKLLSYFITLWVMMGSMALAIVGLVATKN
jgi:hypothetical protein